MTICALTTLQSRHEQAFNNLNHLHRSNTDMEMPYKKTMDQRTLKWPFTL